MRDAKEHENSLQEGQKSWTLKDQDMLYLILLVVKYISYQVAYQNANDSTAGVDGSKGFPQEIRKDLLDIDGRDGSIEGIENSKTEPADDERLEGRDDRESALDESG